MTTPDPLLERLRRLPRPQVDDVTAARTLSRAETAFASAPAPARAPAARLTTWLVPAALAIWGVLYTGGAAREISRLFPAQAEAKPAVACHHRGSSGLDRGAQFMLNAISKTSARTTAITTIAPPRPPVLGASALADVSCEMSSDMDPSMTLVAGTTRLPNVRRGADRGRIAERTAAQSAPAPHSRGATTTTASASRRTGA
jgi:hypothetical protein